jgi:copper(I)-binding protein
LKRPLAPGESIMLTLRFERSGERQIALRVTDASADPSTAGLR